MRSQLKSAQEALRASQAEVKPGRAANPRPKQRAAIASLANGDAHHQQAEHWRAHEASSVKESMEEYRAAQSALVRARDYAFLANQQAYDLQQRLTSALQETKVGETEVAQVKSNIGHLEGLLSRKLGFKLPPAGQQ